MSSRTFQVVFVLVCFLVVGGKECKDGLYMGFDGFCKDCTETCHESEEKSDPQVKQKCANHCKSILLQSTTKTPKHISTQSTVKLMIPSIGRDYSGLLIGLMVISCLVLVALLGLIWVCRANRSNTAPAENASLMNTIKGTESGGSNTARATNVSPRNINENTKSANVSNTNQDTEALLTNAIENTVIANRSNTAPAENTSLMNRIKGTESASGSNTARATNVPPRNINENTNSDTVFENIKESQSTKDESPSANDDDGEICTPESQSKENI